jgi:hypothetical protein
MWRLDLPITERQVTFLWSRTASRFLTVKTGAKKKPRGFGTAAKPENRGPVKRHAAQLNQPISALPSPKTLQQVRQILFDNRSFPGKTVGGSFCSID